MTCRISKHLVESDCPLLCPNKQTNKRAFKPSPQQRCLNHLVRSRCKVEVEILAMALDESGDINPVHQAKAEGTRREGKRA